MCVHRAYVYTVHLIVKVFQFFPRSVNAIAQTIVSFNRYKCKLSIQVCFARTFCVHTHKTAKFKRVKFGRFAMICIGPPEPSMYKRASNSKTSREKWYSRCKLCDYSHPSKKQIRKTVTKNASKWTENATGLFFLRRSISKSSRCRCICIDVKVSHLPRNELAQFACRRKNEHETQISRNVWKIFAITANKTTQTQHFCKAATCWCLPFKLFHLLPGSVRKRTKMSAQNPLEWCSGTCSFFGMKWNLHPKNGYHYQNKERANVWDRRALTRCICRLLR